MASPARNILSSHNIQFLRHVGLIVGVGSPVASIQVPGEERFTLKQLTQTLELLGAAAVNVTFNEPLVFDPDQTTGWTPFDKQLRATGGRRGHLIEHVALQPHPKAQISVDRERQEVTVTSMMARAYVYDTSPFGGVASQPIQAVIDNVVVPSNGHIYRLPG